MKNSRRLELSHADIGGKESVSKATTAHSAMTLSLKSFLLRFSYAHFLDTLDSLWILILQHFAFAIFLSSYPTHFFLFMVVHWHIEVSWRSFHPGKLFTPVQRCASFLRVILQGLLLPSLKGAFHFVSFHVISFISIFSCWFAF